MTKAVFEVSTWDYEKQEFTPQKGVRHRVHGPAGLRRALRALSGMAYDTGRWSTDVLVERVKPPLRNDEYVRVNPHDRRWAQEARRLADAPLFEGAAT